MSIGLIKQQITMGNQKASKCNLMGGGGGVTEGGVGERSQNTSCTKNNLMMSALAVAMQHPRKGQVLLPFASLKFILDYAVSLIAARTRTVLPSLSVGRTSSNAAAGALS